MPARPLTHLQQQRLIRAGFLSGLILLALLAAGYLAQPLAVGAFSGASGPAEIAAAPGARGVAPIIRSAFRQGQVVGQGPNRAALIVRYGDGSTDTRCVAFSEPEIGGDELLERSGLSTSFSPSGGVCSISGQGCPANDCLCRCPLPECEEWSYYLWIEDTWQYSQLHPDSSLVTHGDLQGWSWGEKSFGEGAEPPPVTSFEAICGPLEETSPTPPTATPTTPSPTPGKTPGPAAAPSVTFYSAMTTVAPGQCTTLTWQTTDAQSVTFDGAPVGLQGSQEVCPASVQTWTLVASNAAGQTSRQVTVQVSAPVPGTATPPTPSTIGSPTAGAASTPTRLAPPTVALPTVGTQPRATAPLTAGALPTPAIGLSPLNAAPQGAGGVPLAPTAQPQPVQLAPQATSTRFVLSRPPTETPLPRRALGEGGRPTPTPLLVARAGAGGPPSEAAEQSARSGPASGTGGQQAAQSDVQSRSFSPSLLPGYMAYAATLVLLAAIGWLARRRRHAPPSSGLPSPIEDPQPGRRTLRRQQSE